MQTIESQMNSNDLASSENETLEQDSQNQGPDKRSQEVQSDVDLKNDNVKPVEPKEKAFDSLTLTPENTHKTSAENDGEKAESTVLDKTSKDDGSKLRGKYLCAQHPERMAFALCASCGKYLCADCGLVINARNYCESCTFESPEVGHEIEARVSLIAETNPQILNPMPEPPKRISDLPNAVLSMFTKGPSFFLSVSKTPFWLSFSLAFLAIAPNTIASTLSFVKTPPSIKTDLTPYIETLQGLSTPGLIGLASVVALLQILLLDLAYFLSVRAFTNTTANFKESSSVLHFCLVPLVLTVLATVSDFKFIAFLALGIMIIQCSTATRIFTRASFWQGLLAMLSFIFLVSWGGLL